MHEYILTQPFYAGHLVMQTLIYISFSLTHTRNHAHVGLLKGCASVLRTKSSRLIRSGGDSAR